MMPPPQVTLPGRRFLAYDLPLRGTPARDSDEAIGVSITKTDSMSGAEHQIRPFLKDIEPFFHKAPVIYVDVGAYSGAVFREIFQSGLRPIRSYLVEPNPASYERLKGTVANLEAERVVACYNIALGAETGMLRLRAQDTMTHVLAGDGAQPSEADFEIPARTLDALASEFVAPHISLLKIDVEGHEIEVLAGAAGLLAAQAIDMIYIEAGLDPENRQQTYYRTIEDRLRAHGYRLFRIYEQHHEWATDLPILRRVNLAFFSGKFAEGHPMRLSKELFALRRDHNELHRTLAERDKTLETTRTEAATAVAALNAIEARAAEAKAEHDAALDAARSETTAAVAALRLKHDELERMRVERDKALQTAQAEARHALQAAESRAAETAQALARTKTELEGLRTYCRTLETRYIALLESETWRIMEPARRTIRFLTGKRPPAPFAPRLVELAGGTAHPTASTNPRPNHLSKRLRRQPQSCLLRKRKRRRPS